MALCAPQLDLWLPLYKVSCPGQRRISFRIKQDSNSLTVQFRALILQIYEERCRGICKHLLHIILLQTLLILTLSLIGGGKNCPSSYCFSYCAKHCLPDWLYLKWQIYLLIWFLWVDIWDETTMKLKSWERKSLEWSCLPCTGPLTVCS